MKYSVSCVEALVLCFFDQIKGPSIGYALPLRVSSDPAELPPNLEKQILKLIDTQTAEEFFTYGFETYTTANLYFEIPSEWTRAKRETICLSVLTHSGKAELFKNILVGGARRIKAISNLYKAFHEERRAKDPEVEQKRQELRDYLVKLCQEVLAIRDIAINQEKKRKRKRTQARYLKRDRDRDETRDRERDEIRDRERDEIRDRERDADRDRKHNNKQD